MGSVSGGPIGVPVRRQYSKKAVSILAVCNLAVSILAVCNLAVGNLAVFYINPKLSIIIIK